MSFEAINSNTKSNINSIHQSPEWKAAFERNPWLKSSAYNVLLCMSTDGVNPFRSGQHSCWPIAFKVLNLPPDMASRTDLLILAGIIHGPRKPKIFQAYNLLIVDEILELRRGIISTCGPISVTFRGDMICHSCDLPAHSLVMNQSSVGAHWGCLKCMLRGRTVCRRQAYGQVRRYLPTDHRFRTDPGFGEPEVRLAPEARTGAGTEAAATLAAVQFAANTPKSQAVDTRGVLGECELRRLHYDYTNGAMIDPAHVAKDVMKKVQLCPTCY